MNISAKIVCTEVAEPKAKTVAYQAQAEWRRRNPLARWSHVAVASALKRNLIEKKPCEVCGEVKVDAHHDDHSRPLQIRWMCRLHHRQHHQRLKTELADCAGPDDALTVNVDSDEDDGGRDQ